MPGRSMSCRAIRPGLMALVFSAWSLSAACSWAQVANGSAWPNPKLTSLTPTGGKQGTSVEVAFLGVECEQPEQLWFSHPGIKGVPIIPPPPAPKIDPKTKKPDPKQKEAPPPPITKFTVTIDKSVPPGVYEARLVNQHGVSNPRLFVIGVLNETAEKEPNNDFEQAQKIDLGTTVTGLVNPASDVDYYSVAVKKGQRVLVHCATASIDSRLASEMRIIGPGAREIAYDRALPNQDGVLSFTAPTDGDYLIRLNQFTYLFGGNEHYYRLSVSLGPWIDSVFPPVVEPGKKASVVLHGRNLPGGQADPSMVLDKQVLDKATVEIAAPGDPMARHRLTFGGVAYSDMAVLDGFDYRIAGPNGISNPRIIGFAHAPVVLEKEGNDTVDKAQEVPAPTEIAGRIDKISDRDWYVFNAKKGDSFTIELVSNRFGIASDLYFKVFNQAAKADVTLQDDTPESLTNYFPVSNRDPAPFKLTAPADGKFHVLVASHLAENVVDPTHVYQLRISKEQPEFRLFVMPNDVHRPDSFQIGAGGVETLQVLIHRMNGFKEDVTLSVEGLPPGLAATTQLLNKNMKSGHIVVTAAENAAPAIGSIRVVGTTVIDGKKVVQEARPATVVHAVQPNQNIPTLTRLTSSLIVAVRGKSPGKLTAPEKVVISLGDKQKVSLKLARTSPEFKGNFQVQPIPTDYPPGITFGALTFAEKKDEQQAELTVAANVPPGQYNLVFRGFAPISPQAKGKPVNTILPSTPVQLTILPKSVATLSFDNANPTVKAGTDGVITLKVARQYDYAGEFKVAITLPKRADGLSIANVVIPPGANEAKITIKAAPNAAVRQIQNIEIKAVAVVNGNVELKHDAKFNVNVAAADKKKDEKKK